MSSYGGLKAGYVAVMRMFFPALLLAAGPALAHSALAQPASAQPASGLTELHFAAYAAGSRLAVLTATYALAGPAYRVTIGFRTDGPAAVLFPGGTDSVVTGRIVAGRPRPDRLFSSGAFRGQTRVTQIEYTNDTPHIRQMQPGPDEGREPVPEAQQAHTVDGLTAMGDLVRRVVTTGRCDGEVTVFDGRRLSQIDAKTAETEMLPPSSRSSFSGPALRCAITTRFVAGFMPDTDEQFRKPQLASAWFAPLTPGGPPIPVRVSIPTKFFGEASLYLID